MLFFGGGVCGLLFCGYTFVFVLYRYTVFIFCTVTRLRVCIVTLFVTCYRLRRGASPRYVTWFTRVDCQPSHSALGSAYGGVVEAGYRGYTF